MRRFLLTLALPCAILLALAVPGSAVQPGFRIYADEFALVPLQRLTTGLRFENVPLSQLTTSGAASAPALEALSTWDFTPSRLLPGATDSIGQAVPVSAAWTCYLPDTIACGFGAADINVLLVGDAMSQGRATRDVSAVRYDAATGILSGRATVSDEGSSEELRLCLGTGPSAPIVPVAVFPNVEAGSGRRYLQFTDPQWSSPVFDCFAAARVGAPCRVAGGTAASLDAVTGQTEGRIRNRFVRAGTVTLPSGHVLDALLIESFTSYSGRDSSCVFTLLTVRQWRLAWIVPHYGPVLSVTSNEDVPQLSAFTTAKGATMGYGLLPPVSIQATQLGTDSITVSWNQGLLGDRMLDGYEVHWGAVSGKQQAPAFHSGPLPKTQTSYTITGLAPGQTVHVSVTSRKTYVDPVSGVSTAYESIKLPQFIGSDTNGDGTLDTSYPPEISATTLVPGACVPGDIFPDAVGNGSTTLADFAHGRRKVLGTVAINARDTTCGDVHPGAFSCEPPGQPGRWCLAGNGAFQIGDLVAIRRKVSNTLVFDCGGCPQVAGSLGEALRLPGDVSPRGAADGAVNIADVVFALRSSVGLETPDAEERLRMDVSPADRSSGVAEPTGDAAINVADVVLLLRTTVGLEQLRWPIRSVKARLVDAVDFIGYSAVVSGWPSWASPEADFESLVTGCDQQILGVAGDAWAATCLTDPVVHQGPVDLLNFRYRGIENADPAALTVVAAPDKTYVTRPNLDEPQITLTLSVP